MSEQRLLKQVKIFEYETTNKNIVENSVNEFIIEVFEKHGDFPEVSYTSKYIAVEYEKLVNVDTRTISERRNLNKKL